MKLITIEGDTVRSDRIECITRYGCYVSIGLSWQNGEHYCLDKSYVDEEMARAAQLKAVADWKKALE